MCIAAYVKVTCRKSGQQLLRYNYHGIVFMCGGTGDIDLRKRNCTKNREAHNVIAGIRKSHILLG